MKLSFELADDTTLEEAYEMYMRFIHKHREHLDFNKMTGLVFE